MQLRQFQISKLVSKRDRELTVFFAEQGNSALNRIENRGAHAREDYPNHDYENWLKHALAWLDSAGGLHAL